MINLYFYEHKEKSSEILWNFERKTTRRNFVSLANEIKILRVSLNFPNRNNSLQDLHATLIQLSVPIDPRLG